MEQNTKHTTWDLTPLLSSDNDPKAETKLKQATNANYTFINKWKDRKDYLENQSILKEALDEYEQLARFYSGGGSVGYYFWLRSQQDENDPKLKAKNNKIKDEQIKIANDIQFFTYRIAKISQEKQKEFLESKDLAPYKHFLEDLFKESKYLLSEEEEKILNITDATSYSNWVKMVSGFLAKEERHGKNFSEIMDLLNDRNKETRDNAAEDFNDILEKHADEAEAEINSILEYKKHMDELRKVDRPDFMTHLGDDIDTEVVDAMLEAVEKKFDISQRYYKLKAKLMGVPKLAYHERNVPYGNLDQRFYWEEAVDLVDKTFNRLDPEFSSIFHEFLEKGQLDVFPKKGKASGAFCVSAMLSQPVYVLLNHNGRFDDVTTVAHEMGHAINDIFIGRAQNALNAGNSIALAEVASTFMEDFVLQEITKEADEETKLVLMMEKLNRDVSTIQRQVACYRFEQDLHAEFRKKGYLSKEEIGKLFQKNMGAYMGDGVEMSKGSENWWVYWSHIRRFFYVYSYASGLLVSKSLQNSVKNEPAFIEKVKEFLSAGSSASPKDIFAKVGVDITDKSFWSKGLVEMEVLLNEVESLAKEPHANP